MNSQQNCVCLPSCDSRGKHMQDTRTRHVTFLDPPSCSEAKPPVPHDFAGRHVTFPDPPPCCEAKPPVRHDFAGCHVTFPDPPPCCEAKPPVPDDFAGPYKQGKPPGTRTSAVGDKAWGDVPYLPSYRNPMDPGRVLPSGPTDNLIDRGPFYGGTSETHEEFYARGLPPKRVFHEYVRHYHEPGLKYDKSITQTDFTPPLPMVLKEKAPCLPEEREIPWYTPKPSPARNWHEREVEFRGHQDPKVAYVDELPQHVFSTEYGDSYVCYHAAKDGDKMRRYQPKTDEIFLDQTREAHGKCVHPPPKPYFWDPVRGKGDGVPRQPCPGTAPKNPWLLSGKNYAYRSGRVLIPCKCPNEQQCSGC